MLVPVGLVSCLLLLELLLRAFPRFRPAATPGLVRDARGLALGSSGRVRRHSRTTGDFSVSVAFNRHGLRDRRDASEAPPSSIFVVGDSFSFGWGVEEDERYGNLLERLAGIPVFHLAAPCDVRGYATQVEMGRRLGAPVERVIAGLCLERDVKRYDVAELPDPPPTRLQRAKTWLAEHSALYTAFTALVHHTPALRPVARRLGLVRDPLATKRRPFDPGAVKSTAETLTAALAGLDALVLFIPSRALWHGAQREDAARTHAAVAEALADRGLPVVDPRSAFEADGRPLRHHFENDPHWNRHGHRLVAELLAEAVTARGWAATPRSEA